MDEYWDGQVEQLDRDLAAGVPQADDPMYPGEPDAFPRFLPVPADPQQGHLAGPPNRVGGQNPLPHEQPTVQEDAAVAEELALLRAIVHATRGSASQLVVSSKAPQAVSTIDSPVPGIKRYLLPRTPMGGEVATVEGEWVKVCGANHNRLGGLLVNGGNVGVVLALASNTDVMPATSRLYLAPGGYTWDLRLSGATWAGAIAAKPAAAGTPTLYFAEV